MTVSSTTSKVSYSGNGSTTVFAYTFKVFDEDDLTVILRNDSTGNETVQAITTNYTVSGVGNAGGGNVTFVTAPASGITVVIRRASSQTQTTDYTPNDPFPAEAHEDALDKLTFIAQEVQEELDRAIKISRTNTMTSTEFTVGSTDRANKVLAFDSNGEIAVTQEIGTYQGTDATITTSAYKQRDLIKSTTAAQLDNVYICVADSVIGDLLTDTDHFELVVDGYSAATSATNAASSASAAATSASNASTSETNAATSESNAQDWAVKTNGIVDSTDYSAKAWSIGGTGVTSTSGAGPAKDWAVETTATVDGTEYSSKEYAIGTQAGNTEGSAKQWAIGGGVQLDPSIQVSGNEYSAKYYAELAQSYVTSFDDTYLGAKSTNPATDNSGNALTVGDLYFNSSTNIMRVWTGSQWDDVATNTSAFATNGFAIAMAIALQE